jgi:hypothetical protein
MRISARKLLRLCGGHSFCRFGLGGVAFRVFAAEAFYAAGGVHELLLACKEGMTGGADFNTDIAFVRRARNKCVPAGAMHPDLAVVRMDSCFHVNSTSIQTFDSIGWGKDSARREISQVSALSKTLVRNKPRQTLVVVIDNDRDGPALLRADSSKSETAGPTSLPSRFDSKIWPQLHRLLLASVDYFL